MNLQPVFDLAHICYLKGIRQAVISPGSRNAALTIAFARHPNINCYSVPDERSAAFMALGMSLKTGLPTVLICTSGSAALNYAPAVAEAFFNQVPMLILSADRPPEWIGQRDGQTIYQEGLFGQHVKKSMVFPSLDENEASEANGRQMVNDAINISQEDGKGPVHINIPFREPFYPEAGVNYAYRDELIHEISETSIPSNNWKHDLGKITAYKNILIVVGQSAKSESLENIAAVLSQQYHIPIISDVISNTHQVIDTITSQDVFLKGTNDQSLRPDLLITIGRSVISKNLKLFLRRYQPDAHWHVRKEANAPDTYLALTYHFRVDAEEFLYGITNEISTEADQTEYYHHWQEINKKSNALIQAHASTTFSDFNGYKEVLQALPAGCDLHLANSMAVRYANVIGLSTYQDIEVYCNRGTSGIDGSNSTAVGSALMTDRPTFLLTGDMAFLYDRNAFWHNHMPDHVHMVVFNNHGGGIFRMIEGPSQQPELKEFFETRQIMDASGLANEFNFEYYACHNEKQLKQVLHEFMRPGGPKILEIFTDAEESKKAYKDLFRKLSN